MSRSGFRSRGIAVTLSLWLVSTLGLLGVGCASGAGSRVAGGARLWFEGPVRWLLLADEERRARSLRTNKDAIRFIEAFWKRRDPTPEDRENPFRSTFFERVETADQLYGQGGARGSMTDRGRVFVLLGSPSILRYQQRTVPALSTEGSQGRPQRGTQKTVVEIWVYNREDLDPRLAERLDADGIAMPVSIRFEVGSRRTYLLEGDGVCRRAVEVPVRDP